MGARESRVMPISAEDKTEIESIITEKIGPAVNNMFTARLGTVEKKLSGQLKELTDSIVKSVDEKLSTFKPAPPDDSDDKGGKGKNVELATLRKQIQDLQQSNQKSEERARAAESRRREMERQRTVCESLASGGVKDALMQEMALALLDKRRRIEWSGEDDEATLLWNADDGSQVAFNEGLTSWLKSDEAKHFMPPSGTRGSGARPPATATPPGTKQSPDQVSRNLGEALDRLLG